MKHWILFLSLLLVLVACEGTDSDTESIIEEGTAELEAVINDAGNTLAGGASAELVFINGNIYTVNPEQPWVDAVAIRDGMIVAVGSEEEAFAGVSESAEVIDLDGTMLMPGFQDMHLHAIEAGMNETVCDFEGFLEPEKYVEEVAYCAEEEQPDSEWVRGAGVNMANLLSALGGSRFPIELLDEAVPDRPVLILDDVGHGAWANTLAMQAVGYDKLSQNPPGGVVDRDAETGHLTGVVLENAQQKLRTASLAPTPANLELGYEGLLRALNILGENGITTVSDAGGYWTRGHHQIWARAVAEDTLTVRASNALYLFPDLPIDQQLADFKKHYTNDKHSLLRFNQAKIYVDGIISQGTGLMIEPYTNLFGLPGVPDDGFAYFEIDLLNRYAQELDAAGFQLHFHVTGEGGARQALDVIESTIASNRNNDQRHRLTHLYSVHPDDRARFAKLNVIADFQLAPSSVDPAYAQNMEELIGERATDLLPAFDLHEQGATITISSDWDADTLSPFVKMQSILSQEANNVPPLETIIEWMTINPAYLLHQEDTTGTIEVGKLADLVVLNQNLFEIDPSQLSNTTVLLTFLEGQEVFRHPDAP
ncbi:MAG: amidohydrolase [Ardenticatenaceae bacterium]